jgi:hypothetical protein
MITRTGNEGLKAELRMLATLAKTTDTGRRAAGSREGFM